MDRSRNHSRNCYTYFQNGDEARRSEENLLSHPINEYHSDHGSAPLVVSASTSYDVVAEPAASTPEVRKPPLLRRFYQSIRSFVGNFRYPWLDNSRKKQTPNSNNKLKMEEMSSKSQTKIKTENGVIRVRQSNNLGMERQSFHYETDSLFEQRQNQANSDLDYFYTTFRPPTAFGPSLDNDTQKVCKFSELKQPPTPQDKETKSEVALLKLPPRPLSARRRERRQVFSNPSPKTHRCSSMFLPVVSDGRNSIGTLKDTNSKFNPAANDALGRIGRPHMSNRMQANESQEQEENPSSFQTIDSDENKSDSYSDNFHCQMKLARSARNGSGVKLNKPIPANQMIKILRLSEEKQTDEETVNHFADGDLIRNQSTDFCHNITKENNTPNVERPESREIVISDDIRLMFIPLKESLPVVGRSGPGFIREDRKLNLKGIIGKQIRVKQNRNKLQEIQEKSNQLKRKWWEQRRVIGLFKKKLREENNLQSMRINDDLETHFHHINWFSSGKDNLNYVGRYFDMEENRLVAIKIYGFGFARSETQRLNSKISAMTEINALVQIDCTNVVQMLNYFELSSRIYLVMEACDHSLRSEIVKAVKGVHPKMAQGVLRQVLNGLDFCHNLGCLHSDISPDNILVTSDGIVKLADFEKSLFLTGEEKLPCPAPGTITYGAPELLVRNSEYGLAADIWSVGCLLGELLKGTPLWNSTTEAEQIERIQATFGVTIHRKSGLTTYISTVRNGSNTLREMFPRISEDAVSFVSKCLELDPKKRSTCEGLLQHNFLKCNREAVEVKREKTPMAEALLPRTEIWALRPQSAPVAKFTTSENNIHSNTHINYEEVLTRKIQEFESQDHNQGDFVYNEQEAINLCDEKLPPKEKLKKKTKKYKKKATTNSGDESIETSSNGWENHFNMIDMDMNMNIGGSSHLSSYDSVSDSSGQVPSILKKGEVKAKKKKCSKVSFVCTEDVHNVPSSLLCCAAQVNGENPLVTLNLPRTPRALLKHIIGSIRCSTWNTVEVYTGQLKRACKMCPKVFESQIGLLISTLLDQISITKSKVAGPSIRILRALYDFAPKFIETETEKIVSAMLLKLGGPYFIDAECYDILNQIVLHTNPIKASLALIRAGVQQKQGATRGASAKYLCIVIARLNFAEDIGDDTTVQRRLTSNLFDAAARFTRDVNASTKDYGKEMFRLLLQHPQFWRLYLSNVPEEQRNRINQILDEIRRINPILDEVRRNAQV